LFLPAPLPSQTYTLSLHDALPILEASQLPVRGRCLQRSWSDSCTASPISGRLLRPPATLKELRSTPLSSHRRNTHRWGLDSCSRKEEQQLCSSQAEPEMMPSSHSTA